MKNKELTPFLATHPGEMIKDELKERGMTQKQLAAETGIKPSVLSETINGKRGVSLSVAMALGKALNIPADIWMNLQTQYDLVQSGHYERLCEIVSNDYETYSGKELEDYFKDKIMQSEPVESIGSWWETSRKANKTNEQNEVDIVATYYNEKKVLIAEVKRQRKNFKLEKFQEKVENLRTRMFYDWAIETRCLTIEDM